MEKSEETVSLHFWACMVFEGVVQSKATETLDSNFRSSQHGRVRMTDVQRHIQERIQLFTRSSNSQCSKSPKKRGVEVYPEV